MLSFVAFLVGLPLFALILTFCVDRALGRWAGYICLSLSLLNLAWGFWAFSGTLREPDQSGLVVGTTAFGLVWFLGIAGCSFLGLWLARRRSQESAELGTGLSP